MVDNEIQELTDLVKTREKFLGFFVWKTARGYGITLPKEEIEDILGDAYLKAATILQSPRRSKIKFYMAWFVRILFLTCMNTLRKRMLRNKSVDAAVLEDLADTAFVYDAIQAADSKVIRDVMNAKLDETERLVLEMNINGYSYDEISQKLERPADAVRQLKSRAVKKLKKIFNGV